MEHEHGKWESGEMRDGAIFLVLFYSEGFGLLLALSLILYRKPSVYIGCCMARAWFWFCRMRYFHL